MGSAQGRNTQPPGVEEIARSLEEHGEMVVVIPPGPPQELVDLHWAAHQAGRRVGFKVRVSVEGPGRGNDPVVTVTIRPRSASERLTAHRP